MIVRARYAPCLALILCLAAASVPAAALTERQAVKRAQDFLNAIGREVPSQEARASRLTGNVEAGSWGVSFGSGLDVEVSDSTGRIMAFFDRQATDWRPVETPISKEEAERLATGYMEAAGGLPEGAVFHYARAEALVAVPGVDSRKHPAAWAVLWKRYIGPYRVLPDQLSVDLQAATGKLVLFRNTFLTPAPASTEPTLTREQAEAAARKDVTQVGDAKLDKAYLLILARRFGPDVEPSQRNPVLAWQLQFGEVGVSVDARTGEFLSMSMPKGSVRRPSDSSAPRAPQRATADTTKRQPIPALYLGVLVGAIACAGGGWYAVLVKRRRRER